MLKRDQLPLDEWLSDAERLPVGQSKRVYHGSEDRANMVVRNEEGRYSAYCYECNRRGHKSKQHVRLLPAVETPQPSRNPGVLIPFTSPSIALRLREEFIRHFQRKGVSAQVLEACPPVWSAQDQRLIYRTPDGMIGRALSDAVPQKWHTYSHAEYIRSRPYNLFGRVVALTEDYYSAMKISYYVPDVIGVSCQGTRIGRALLAALLQAKHVYHAFDGDYYGNLATTNAARQLTMMAIPNSPAMITQGLDPKDMTPNDLIHAFP